MYSLPNDDTEPSGQKEPCQQIAGMQESSSNAEDISQSVLSGFVHAKRLTYCTASREAEGATQARGRGAVALFHLSAPRVVGSEKLPPPPRREEEARKKKKWLGERETPLLSL